MAEKIKTVADGTRLLTTQTGKERERLSRLFGVFMEDDLETGGKRLVMRNFPSQRIMNDFMKETGWTHPSKKGEFVIFRGNPLAGLKLSTLQQFAELDEMLEGVQAVPEPTSPRPPAAPKPVVSVAAEAVAGDVSDVSTPDDLDVSELLDDEGGISL